MVSGKVCELMRVVVVGGMRLSIVLWFVMGVSYLIEICVVTCAHRVLARSPTAGGDFEFNDDVANAAFHFSNFDYRQTRA